MRVLVFGTFDDLHHGHRFVLEEALKRGETHVVVARDRNVEKIKGRLPKQNEEERKRTIKEAFPDVHPVLGDDSDFLAPVRDVKPDLIVLGYDQSLPPGIHEKDLPCRVKRLPAFKPEEYKSSLRRGREGREGE